MKLHDTIDVLIGGYMSKDAAEEDYNAVRDSGAHLQGMALIAKDLEGNLSVEETDHMVREGTAAPWRRRVGGRAGRAAAAGDDRDRGRAGRRRRRAASPQDRRQDRGAGGRDDSARRRGPDRRLLEVRGREGRARRDPRRASR